MQWSQCERLHIFPPHDIFGNFEIFSVKPICWIFLIVKMAKIDFENVKFCLFRGSLRKNLQSKSYRVGIELIESIETLRTSLDARSFYMVSILPTSTAFFSGLREPIWKIPILHSKKMSVLHFMFSSIFWNQSFRAPNSKFSDRSFRKIRNIVSRKNFEMGENMQNFHTVWCGKARTSLSPKNISSNQLFSNSYFSKTVTFTKFLQKKE